MNKHKHNYSTVLRCNVKLKMITCSDLYHRKILSYSNHELLYWDYTPPPPPIKIMISGKSLYYDNVTVLWKIFDRRLLCNCNPLFCVWAEVQADISVIQLDNSEQTQMHRKLTDFLDAVKAKEEECDRNEALADRIDKAFFWFYFILGTLYFCTMITVMVKYECDVNHLDFL